ncbi:hypothetical protein CALCODRAFT_25383 [Calocera cornea HHB12733]|uniref:Protein argonaute N-terminal domain-containing protein n=1 Tax=Calocera cornea HHB12733 TaxID=1353952 RepID=A0A165J2F6_9BASI|nr:hypothetical protein CALCODRAFT_25383 [Calocera cornea HHB12733]
MIPRSFPYKVTVAALALFHHNPSPFFYRDPQLPAYTSLATPVCLLALLCTVSHIPFLVNGCGTSLLPPPGTETRVPDMSRPGGVREIVVYANYLPLSTPFPTKQLYQYDVVIHPEIKGRVIERQREIIDRLQTHVAAQLFARGRAVYDGRSILISTYELPFGDGAPTV